MLWLDIQVALGRMPMRVKLIHKPFLSELEGNTETWVEIPEDQWPQWWRGKFKRPCVRLLRNLYGHPLAGLFWEKHCNKAIQACGFTPVQGWECHHQLKVLLSVYVDDF